MIHLGYETCGVTITVNHQLKECYMYNEEIEDCKIPNTLYQRFPNCGPRSKGGSRINVIYFC